MKLRNIHIVEANSQNEQAFSEIKKDIAYFWSKKSELDSNVYTPVWQTIEWNIFLSSTGAISRGDFFGVYDEKEQLLGYCFSEIRSVGVGFLGIFIIGGPNILCEGDLPVEKEVKELLFQTVQEFSQEQGALFLQYEAISEKNSSFQAQVLDTKNARYFIEPFTRMINLLQAEETILADMKQKGRYNIRIAEKNGCIAAHVPSTEENLDIFMKLLSETLERDNFSGNSREYYKHLLASRSHPVEGLYFVTFEGNPIAAAILVMVGSTAVYYYGASTSDNFLRRNMPAYLLQWEMIRSAKKAGAIWYDFLGIADPENPGGRLEGVSDFKSKFGGTIVKWPEKKIIILRTVAFFFFSCLRFVKNLKK